ncbi:MAG: hypothetical protein ACKPKO_03695, partial [Candidatus Fonsibacter sp.]
MYRDMKALTIPPIKNKDYTVRQSNYVVEGKRPIRISVFGPSGSAGTVLLSNMFIDICNGRFERIY